MAGCESAFVELPWGFLFQQGRPNEGVASGFPVYGLSRLAEASGGRLFLYYPPPKRKVPGADSDETTTAPERPARGGPSTGSGGGPTTGGD